MNSVKALKANSCHGKPNEILPHVKFKYKWQISNTFWETCLKATEIIGNTNLWNHITGTTITYQWLHMKTIKKQYSSDIHNVHGSVRHCWQCAWTAHDKTTEQPHRCWFTASDHYFRSVCLFVCLFVCAEFFSAVFDPISIKLGHMLHVWV